MAELTYLNFDLSIEGGGGQYRARASSSAGQAKSVFGMPISEKDLEIFYLKVGRPRQGVRRLDSDEMKAAKEVGELLFEAVFGDEVYGCFRASLNEAETQGKGLRLRLRVDAAELTSLPWEYLYNPRLNRFLSLSVNTPIVRYLDLPERPETLKVQPPLKVLAMISSPGDYPPLDVEREWRQLKEALGELEGRGLVSLERLEHASLEALNERLWREEVHVFHFIGHGKYDESAQDGLLLFEDERGRGRKLNGQSLGTILHNQKALRLAVLNACEGARTSRDDPYSGAAQSLVQQGIPAVVAMQFEITDDAAIAFARNFYSALAGGHPVDAALVKARTAIYAQDNDIEWGTPVYFTRAQDGRIFDLVSTTTEELYRQSFEAIDEEKWVVAIGTLERLLEMDADYPTAATLLEGVRAEHEKSEWEQRITDLLDEAGAALAAQEWNQAIQILGKLLEMEPDLQPATDLLERAQEGKAGAEKAQKIAALMAEADAAWEAKDWGRVVEKLKLLLSIEPDHIERRERLAEAQKQLELEKLYAQAQDYLREGRLERASEILERVREIDASYRNVVVQIEELNTRIAERDQRERRLAEPLAAPSLDEIKDDSEKAPKGRSIMLCSVVLVALAVLCLALGLGYAVDLLGLRTTPTYTIAPSTTSSLTSLTGTLPAITDTPMGTEEPMTEIGTVYHPIKVLFVPSVDVDFMIESASLIEQGLGEATGLKYEVSIPISYSATIEEMCAFPDDTIGFIPAMGYVLANQLCGVDPGLASKRYGWNVYWTQFIVARDSEFKTLGDLGGATWGYTDISSTIGYLYPSALFSDQGITPGDQIDLDDNTQVVRAVYNGEVDFATTFFSPPLLPEGYWSPDMPPDIPDEVVEECTPDEEGRLYCGGYRVMDARSTFAFEAPDVVQKVRIMAITPEIPNDTLSFAPDFPEELKQTIMEGVVTFLGTGLCQQSLCHERFYYWTDASPIFDENFDGLRILMEFHGITLENIGE